MLPHIPSFVCDSRNSHKVVHPLTHIEKERGGQGKKKKRTSTEVG